MTPSLAFFCFILAGCCFLVRTFTAFPRVELSSLGLFFLTVGFLLGMK